MTKLELKLGSQKSFINSFQVIVILDTAKIEICLYTCTLIIIIDVADDYQKDWENKIITALISSFTRVICSFKREASWRMLSISRSTLKKKIGCFVSLSTSLNINLVNSSPTETSNNHSFPRRKCLSNSWQPFAKGKRVDSIMKTGKCHNFILCT